MRVLEVVGLDGAAANSDLNTAASISNLRCETTFQKFSG